MSQANPVIIVTGASRGIGRGIACAAARSGYSVVINFAGNVRAAKETLRSCGQNRKDRRQRFVPVQADVSTDKGRSRLVAETLGEFGRIDALVNNAGIGPRVRVDITEMTEKSYAEVMRVNLQGPLFLTQKVVKYWLRESVTPLLPAGFKVIFISSLSAYAASTERGEYCISKAGLSMVSKLWATRLARENIQVFEVRPGIIETDMTAGVKEKYERLISGGLVPQMRWGKPEDIGASVASILQGNFPFSTGEVINVDGGFHMQRL